MKLDVEPNEAQFLLQVLGQLPTQSGAFLLLQKLSHSKCKHNNLSSLLPSLRWCSNQRFCDLAVRAVFLLSINAWRVG